MIIGKDTKFVTITRNQYYYMLAIQPVIDKQKDQDKIEKFTEEAKKPIAGQRSKMMEEMLETITEDDNLIKAYITIINWNDPANCFPIPNRITQLLAKPS